MVAGLVQQRTTLATLGLDRGRITFIPQMNHTRVRLEADQDHLFKEVPVWLFWSTSKFDCCIHTSPEELNFNLIFIKG